MRLSPLPPRGLPAVLTCSAWLARPLVRPRFLPQIQRTIREEFAGAIVITIAHRLKTVLDYDRILVLGSGEILEFDTPEALIDKPGGVFREMCRASADWADLHGVAHSSARSGSRS